MELKNKFNAAITANWITEPKTDTQYSIKENGEEIIIKIQGSVSRKDWIQNFMFWKKPYKNMEKIFFVHAGFLKKFKAIEPEIKKAVKLSSKPIKVLGYSQGAGIGYIVHEYLRFHFPNRKIESYLFEPPRAFTLIGSKILKERFKNLTIILNGNDIVTKVPPVLFLYRHYGKKYLIGQKRKVFRFSIKEHYISSVRKALKEV